MMIDRTRPWPILAAMLIAPALARAGPPFQTDDPNVVELHRTEMLIYYQSALAQNGRFGTLPGLELHYGLLDRTELDVIPTYAFAIAPGGATAHGFGDTVLGFKYAIVPDVDGFMLSAVPKVSFDTGNASRGLGNGGNAVFLALAAQQVVGDFQAYGNAGYWINNGPGNRNYVFAGGVAQYRIDERWTLGGEIFYNGAAIVGQQSSVGFNVGGYFAIDPHSQLLFSIGRGLKNASETNRVSAYFGGQLSF